MPFPKLLAPLLLTACFALAGQEEVTARERELLERIAKLEARLAALEQRLGVAGPSVPEPPAAPEKAPKQDGWPESVRVGLFFDGYYGWNRSRPAGRVNLLRAYDGTANSFSLNQTGMVLAREPGVGERWGFRLDLMAGQATETLQGGAQNELRPAVYRHVFQAYGRYVAPVGRGLTVDFGKWASALGPEGNYTKEQINYSRSYFFNFLPFYHMGLRTAYAVNDRVGVSYWLVNGANQTEDFNGFKSQLGQVTLQAGRKGSWTVNYYNGREQRDRVPMPARPMLRGRMHIVDTYAFWNATERLTLGGELDYVVNRVDANGPPQRVTGGAAYARFQVTPRIYLGQRYVRLNDRAGLFSGARQELNDVTSTAGIRLAEGFETRLEYRRDFSNVRYFLTRDPGVLARSQDTFTVGLLWWLGAW
jgi:hypothetical protein